MKLRVTIDGQDSLLDLQHRPGETAYSLEGAVNTTGNASIAEVMPGVFSILLGEQNYTVHVAQQGEDLETVTGGHRFRIALADVRDRSAKLKKYTAAGPMEIRAHMPGKVVKLLVEPGATVQAGQGLIVVEAMKMQNEMKAPKDGVVAGIYAAEGVTVAAGEKLMVVE